MAIPRKKNITKSVGSKCLTVLLRLKIWLLKQLHYKEFESKGELPVLARDEYYSAGLEKDLADWLRHTLRSYPYWSEGHLELARIAISNNQISLAYCSLLAVIQLEGKKSLRYLAATALLGKIYLRSGRLEESIQCFNKVLKGSSIRTLQDSVHEDLAAAYIEMKEFDSAIGVFNALGIENLSPSGRAAYDYAATKSRQQPV